MIKVAYLISTLSTGGAEVQLVRTVNLIDKTKFHLKVFVLTNINDIESKLEEDIEVEYLNINSYINPKGHFIVQKKIKKFNPDILHSVLYAANIFARLYKICSAKTKIINHIHGLGSWIKRPHILLDRALLPFVDKIIVVSQKSKNIRLTREIYPPEKIKVVYNCVNEDRFKPNIEKENKLFICLGVACRLVQLKNVNYIIKICKILKDFGLPIKLKIAGDGPEKGNLLKLINQLNLYNEIIILGKVKNMTSFYQEIDCFILSSKIEDLPLSIVEALMTNKPFISSNVGGIEELTYGTKSLLFNLDDDINNNALKIKHFLENIKYNSSSQENRNYAKEVFGELAHKNAIESIYYELLKKE